MLYVSDYFSLEWVRKMQQGKEGHRLTTIEKKLVKIKNLQNKLPTVHDVYFTIFWRVWDFSIRSVR